MHESRAPVDAAAQPVQRQVVGQVAALVLGGSEGLERGATAAHEVDIGEGARGGERRSVEEEHALLRARVGVRVRVRVGVRALGLGLGLGLGLALPLTLTLTLTW